MKGDGRVFKRGRYWWVAFYFDGQEYRESSQSRNRKDAVTLLRQRVGEVATGIAPHPTDPKRSGKRVVMVEDLLDLVEQNHRLNKRRSPVNGTCLRRLRARFTGYSVRRCTSLVITEYMESMQREGRKPETINREIAVLRFAFRLGYQHDLVARVPAFKLLPQLAVRNEFFTREEIDVLLPCLPDYLRDVVLFAFLTGWRKGEVTGLTWASVNRSTGVIRLDPHQNKGGMVRVLVLEGELSALIERRWHARKSGDTLAEHVFHRPGHRQMHIRYPWLIACKRAGLGHRMFHSLRRSAARNMSMQGIPEKVIMSIMGHKSRVMFDRYNIVTEADQRVYAKRLFGPQHGQ